MARRLGNDVQFLESRQVGVGDSLAMSNDVADIAVTIGLAHGGDGIESGIDGAITDRVHHEADFLLIQHIDERGERVRLPYESTPIVRATGIWIQECSCTVLNRPIKVDFSK
jgi:hypothetical protein